MPSNISWLDSTPEEQRAARELVAMFSDKESRDELGIGPVRDAFSELLFPGTSVLQTRARYYLFVPWCYSTADVLRLTGASHREKGRANERRLIKALRDAASDDKAGLIGARAGVGVQNLPSVLYWSGMLRYGIRQHRGDFGSLPRLLDTTDGATEMVERVPAEWNATIPPPPADFPEVVEDVFEMSYAEASWLRERITLSAPGTLLAHLLERGSLIPDAQRAPWDGASGKSFEALHHARLFSAIVQGAALLYNFLIAERYAEAGLDHGDGEHPVDKYKRLIASWQADVMEPLRGDLSSWDIARMWEVVRSTNANVPGRTEAFVNDWITALRSRPDLMSDNSLHKMIADREKRKGAQSRLKNEKMLAAWSGASGTGRLTYRWGTVTTLVNDIVKGLDRAGA